MERLDKVLIERLSTNPVLLTKDFVSVQGSKVVDEPEVSLRLFGSSWFAPWGGVFGTTIPPTKIERISEKVTRILIKTSQHKVRHFLSDASIFVKYPEPREKPKVVRAVLKTAEGKILQEFDSEFSCNISRSYKHGEEMGPVQTSLNKEYIIASPLFFDLPLKVLPLFLGDFEIEYDIQMYAEGELECFVEVETSLGEIGVLGLDGKLLEKKEEIRNIQYYPSFKTYTKILEEGATRVSIELKDLEEGFLVRSLYFRIFNDLEEDIEGIIQRIDIVSPSRGSKLLGDFGLPALICRKHYKTRYTNPQSFSRARVPGTLPFYVIPFAVSPSGNNADYAVLMTNDTEVIFDIAPNYDPLEDVEDKKHNLILQICLEKFESNVWTR